MKGQYILAWVKRPRGASPRE